MLMATDRDLAERAYREKRYAQACELYERATKAMPRDGALWSDLGLCFLKLDKRPEALAALQRAVTFGAPATRLHAYFNLATLGVDLLASRFDGEVPAASGCANRWWSSTGHSNVCGTGLCHTSSGLYFGSEADVAHRKEAYDEQYTLTLEEVDSQFVGRNCDRYSGCAVCGGGYGATPPKTRRDIERLQPRIKRCVRAREKACAVDQHAADNKSGGCHAIDEGCENEACGVEGKLSKDEQRLKEESEKCIEECNAVTPETDQLADFSARCTLVSINPCAKALGIVCRGDDGKLQAQEISVAE